MPNPTPPANPPAIHGKDGLLCIGLTDLATVTPLALITEWNLDMSTDMVETTAMSDSNKTYAKGLRDLKMTFSGVWDSTDDAIFEAAEHTAPIFIKIYPTKDNAASWGGPGHLDVSIKGGNAAAVTIEGNITAAGAWTRTPSGTPPV